MHLRQDGELEQEVFGIALNAIAVDSPIAHSHPSPHRIAVVAAAAICSLALRAPLLCGRVRLFSEESGNPSLRVTISRANVSHDDDDAPATRSDDGRAKTSSVYVYGFRLSARITHCVQIYLFSAVGLV